MEDNQKESPKFFRVIDTYEFCEGMDLRGASETWIYVMTRDGGVRAARLVKRVVEGNE